MNESAHSIIWNLAQIRELVNEFEGRYLPVFAVGAIEGYCNNITRIAMRLERPEDWSKQ